MTETGFLWVSTLLAFTGSALIHLASRHQRLLPRPLPRKGAMAAGFALEATAFLVVLQCRSPATSAFMLVTFLMAAWSLTPLFIALATMRRKTP